MMAAVLQLSVVRSVLFFITLVLWTDEQYDYGDVSLSSGPWSVLIFISRPDLIKQLWSGCVMFDICEYSKEDAGVCLTPLDS